MDKREVYKPSYGGCIQGKDNDDRDSVYNDGSIVAIETECRECMVANRHTRARARTVAMPRRNTSQDIGCDNTTTADW